MELTCKDYDLVIINVYMPFLDRSDLQCAMANYDEMIGFIDFIMSKKPNAKFIVLK